MKLDMHPDFVTCRERIRTLDDLPGKVFATAGPYGWNRIGRVEVVGDTVWVSYSVRTPKGRWARTWAAPFPNDADTLERALEYFLRGGYNRRLVVES